MMPSPSRSSLRRKAPRCSSAVLRYGAKERATANGTLRAAVENEVQQRLQRGKAKKQTIAKALALSARTLSRRLADEGTTYEEVVDQLRQTLALQYIKDRGISISQIAWLLGYEGSTSFNHAFKRWTGRSPVVARNEERPAEIADAGEREGAQSGTRKQKIGKRNQAAPTRRS